MTELYEQSVTPVTSEVPPSGGPGKLPGEMRKKRKLRIWVDGKDGARCRERRHQAEDKLSNSGLSQNWVKPQLCHLLAS